MKKSMKKLLKAPLLIAGVALVVISVAAMSASIKQANRVQPGKNSHVVKAASSKKYKPGKYPLVAVDNESSNDGETIKNTIVIFYMDGQTKKSIKLPLDEEGRINDYYFTYSDRLLTNDQTQPYLKISKSSYETKLTIYRQPYLTYNQSDLTGEVVDKTVNQ